jgi:uncharacterized protein (TIGR01777 family)
MKKVIITGGTGLVGQSLIPKLKKAGFSPNVLSRSKRSEKGGVEFIQWNPALKKVDSDELKECDALIHLAGANVGSKRWNKSRKAEIISSRVDSLNLLYHEFEKLGVFPKTVISASAIGYYGMKTSPGIYDEQSPNGNDFLAEVCSRWEEAAHQFNPHSRVVILRIGVVLSNKGGALVPLNKLTNLGLYSPLGSGKHYMPWSHIDDLSSRFVHALMENTMAGPYNAVSQGDITQKDFLKTLAKVRKKPFFMPNVPAFVFKLIFGEMSQILLEGKAINGDKIKKAGYNFMYPTLESAFKSLM